MAIDIGTESVKAAVFSMKAKGGDAGRQNSGESGGFEISVHSAACENFKGEGLITPPFDFKNLSFVFRRAVSEAARLAKINHPKFFPKQAAIGIDGALAFGFPVTISFKRENPNSEIDLRELKNIIQKTQWQAREEAKRICALKAADFSAFGGPEKNGEPHFAPPSPKATDGRGEASRGEPAVELISSAIQRVTIDGYQVANPVGFPGKEISVSIFNAYLPKTHFEQLQEIFQTLSLKTLFVVFTPFAVFQSLKNLPKKTNQFNFSEGGLLIDVGGEQTQVSLFSKSRLECVNLVSFGGNSFTRKIASQIGVGFWEAEEIKQRYAERRISESVSQKLKAMLQKEIELLRDSARMAVEEIPKISILPPRIFVFGGGAKTPGVFESFESEEFWKTELFLGKPDVKRFNFSEAFVFEDRFDFLRDPQYSVLASLMYFSVSELLSEETAMAKILKKISLLFK